MPPPAPFKPFLVTLPGYVSAPSLLFTATLLCSTQLSTLEQDWTNATLSISREGLCAEEAFSYFTLRGLFSHPSLPSTTGSGAQMTWLQNPALLRTWALENY